MYAKITQKNANIFLGINQNRVKNGNLQRKKNLKRKQQEEKAKNKIVGVRKTPQSATADSPLVKGACRGEQCSSVKISLIFL